MGAPAGAVPRPTLYKDSEHAVGKRTQSLWGRSMKHGHIVPFADKYCVRPNMECQSTGKRFLVHDVWHFGRVAAVVALEHVDQSLHAATGHAFVGID